MLIFWLRLLLLLLFLLPFVLTICPKIIVVLVMVARPVASVVAASTLATMSMATATPMTVIPVSMGGVRGWRRRSSVVVLRRGIRTGTRVMGIRLSIATYRGSGSRGLVFIFHCRLRLLRTATTIVTSTRTSIAVWRMR